MEAMKENEIDLQEAILLAAHDNEFYAHFFFPKTARQKSPDFHKKMDDILEGPERLGAFMLFRGSAKTTKVRLTLSKRVAYAISRTILVVGKSQDHAKRTIGWLMRNVEYNTFWANSFGLRKGKKWSEEEIEIFHGVDDVPIRVLALGITGSTRGINIDDYRPDFILIDDPCDEENTATKEQREKTDNFINGSLRNSLAPQSESPRAKMVLAQTLLHPDDSISRCIRDPAWATLVQGVFTENGESAWPERWTTDELKAEKQSFIDRGKLSLWMREMECKIVSDELSVFRSDLLRYYEVHPDNAQMAVVLTCDPVPPPSEREIAMGFKGKDSEAWAALGLWVDRVSGQRKIIVLETRTMTGHDPDWSVKTFFEMLDRWHPYKLKVESVNYQRTLAWLIEKAMKRARRYVQIDAHTPERRKKHYRIIDAIGAALSAGELYVHQSQQSLIEAIHTYPNVDHDDELEAVSVGVAELLNVSPLMAGVVDYVEAEKDIPELDIEEVCP